VTWGLVLALMRHIPEADATTEFKRRQWANGAAGQAKPEGSRDQAALERDLEAARRAVYGNAKP